MKSQRHRRDGAVLFKLAAGTGTWWEIDATDIAYWAVQENINAMRATGGLPGLTMDDSLSATADARCESFAAGGPFDHSGMVTKSESSVIIKAALPSLLLMIF